MFIAATGDKVVEAVVMRPHRLGGDGSGGTTAAGSASGIGLLHCKVQAQHVHPGFAEHTEAGVLYLFPHQVPAPCNYIDAHRKISVAAKPSAVRPACSAAHFSIKARLSAPALPGSIAMSLRFVGMMPRSV